jgi:hypothetical protein
MSSTDRHPAEALTAGPQVYSLSRHFPTFYLVWKCLISFRYGLWRRRRAIASAMAVAALALVILWGFWEVVVGPQRNAVAAIENAGGSVAYDWEWKNGRRGRPGAEPPWPKWLVRTLGRDLFGHVVEVELFTGHADCALMTHIGRLTHLERLFLSGTTLTGTGLANLEKLTALEKLVLPNHISDDDLAHLAGLTRLKHLYVPSGAQITNRGLTHLSGMRQLESLGLINARITTLEPIRGLTQLKQLQLEGAPITDEGLEPLHAFTSLQWLLLDETQVTDAGIAHFSTMSNLGQLDLARTRIGDAGTAPLQPSADHVAELKRHPRHRCGPRGSGRPAEPWPYEDFVRLRARSHVRRPGGAAKKADSSERGGPGPRRLYSTGPRSSPSLSR